MRKFVDFCTEPSNPKSLEAATTHFSQKALLLEDLTDPSEKNLTWFLQISDIHISSFGRGQGTQNMQYFLKNIIPMINPLFVLATGDLTDSSNPLFFGYQEITEWETYKNLLVEAGFWNKESNFWIDIRGNHDSYDVPTTKHKNDLFSTYSVTQEYDFVRKWVKDDLEIGVVAFDACPKVGFNRFLNFVGYLLPEDVQRLRENIDLVKKSNFVIGIGHYPLSILQVPFASKIKELTSQFSVYLCGHLHRLAGDELRTIHDNGMGEFEIPDMKTGAIFRIMSLDHGLFSFKDYNLTDFKAKEEKYILLVTNPKDARYHITSEAGENAFFSKNSKNIRILLFTTSSKEDSELLRMKVFIDGVFLGEAHKANDSNVLWRLPWNPLENYSEGLHSIRVILVDSKESVLAKEEFQFSIDGSSASRPWNILHAPFGKWFKSACLLIQLFLWIYFLAFARTLGAHKTIYYFSIAYLFSQNFLPQEIGYFVPSDSKLYFSYFFAVFDKHFTQFPVLDTYIYYCVYMLTIYIPSLSCLVTSLSEGKRNYFTFGRSLWFIWCLFYFVVKAYHSSLHYFLSPKVICAVVYAVYALKFNVKKQQKLNKKID